jgi:hypothetical protein
MIAELLNRFEQESEGLLREISKHVDDEMLTTIAKADYEQDQDRHLAELRRIRDEGTFPPNMVWFPGEVLELTRWSPIEEAHPDIWQPNDTDHWIRAFCCVALLRATREPYNYGDGISTTATVIRLILSLHALPASFNTDAVRFLAWLLLNSDPEGRDDQVCAYGIGLLWFALQTAPPFPDEKLIDLSKWIFRRAAELYPKLLFDGSSIPLRMGVGNPPPSLWGLLGVMFCDMDLSGRSKVLQTQVRMLGERLAE